MNDKEVIRLAKKFRGWRVDEQSPDLWLGDDFAFSPQAIGSLAEKRAQEALEFCEAAPDFILRLLDGLAKQTVEDFLKRGNKE